MKNKLVLGFSFFFAILGSSSALADGWNLKGLDTVAVEETQTPLVISQATMLQLDTDAKIKLKSAGLTLASPQDAKAFIMISLACIKGITNEWVLVQLTVQEKAQTSSRKTSQKVDAITYIDAAFFETPKGAADKKIYDATLNNLVTKLVNEYLNQNSK
jgi:hypothetical protein